MYTQYSFSGYIFIGVGDLMLAIFTHCMEIYKQVFQDGPYLTLFICAIIYVFLDHNEQVKKVFLGHTLLFSFIYWCPVTAYIIAIYCIGADTYWRMFWMLPVTIFIAYVFTRLFDHANGWIKKSLLFVTIVVLVMDCGSRIYNSTNFQPATNPYKLNQTVVDAADIIRTHADENGVEDIGVLPADIFALELREYDAGIRMPYGRDMLRGHNKKKTALEIYYCMNIAEAAPEVLKTFAEKGNYQYLTYSAETDWLLFEDAGYTMIGHSGGYNIYYIELE